MPACETQPRVFAVRNHTVAKKVKVVLNTHHVTHCKDFDRNMTSCSFVTPLSVSMQTLHLLIFGHTTCYDADIFLQNLLLTLSRC